jgi:hypothetical protein
MPDVGTRLAVLLVDDVEYTDSISTATIRSAETDSDFVSFEDAAAGGRRDYTLAVVMKQNTTAASLWDVVWAQAGADLDVELWPNGRPADPFTPTPTQPRFSGTVTITDPDGDLLGGEANPSTSARQTTEVEWMFTAKPTKATS